ncbi:MAG: TRAP transporter large permease [Alphaproteobacteria bacterium]
MVILIYFVVLCVFLVIGTSVPIAFGGVLVAIAFLSDHDVSAFLPTGHWKMNTLVLLAIPLFILAGGLMERGRIAAPLVNLAEVCIGWIRGGLASATVISSAIFGAISGSAAATLTCIGSVMLPHLRRTQHDEGASAALVVSAAPLGLLIPPSSAQIIYAWVTQQSVLKCFLSTIVPGLILVVLLCLTNTFILKNIGSGHDRAYQGAWPKAFARESKRSFAALLIPVFILGGIYGGFMTPTEAAGFAVIYAFLIGFFVYRGLNLRSAAAVLRESAITIGVVMVMIFMVLTVSRFLIFENIPGMVLSLVGAVSDSPIIILLLVNLALVLIGMVMDDISSMLLSAPLLLPVVSHVGVDPIHFAAILGVNLGMANITPPTAPLLYLGARTAGVSVNQMLRPTLIFILFAWLPTLMLTTFVPNTALWLPGVFFD